MSKTKETTLGRPEGGPEKKSPLIIGIGASAGGLEALQQFFGCMPNNSGLSFVVVQHLSPDYKSLMADILGKHTGMTVLQAENAMPVEPDTVYLIPPKKFMTLQDGKLLLSDYAPGTLNHPIDVFFASLAEEKKEHSIVVVLSGTGLTAPTASRRSRSTAAWSSPRPRRAPSSTACPRASSTPAWPTLSSPGGDRRGDPELLRHLRCCCGPSATTAGCRRRTPSSRRRRPSPTSTPS